MFERLSEPQYQLTEEKCKIFLRQILSGVAFLHQENIIHMNITPYNIIFHNKVSIPWNTWRYMKQIIKKIQFSFRTQMTG